MFPICPLCNQPVNTNTDAHITETDGTVKHHECPTANDSVADDPAVDEDDA